MTLEVTPEARQVLAEWLARDASRRARRNDRQLNRKLGGRLLTLEPATGDLRQTRLGLRWFSGGHLSS